MNDNKMVNKVETFKSGIFAFSFNFDRGKLAGPLGQAQMLYATVAEIPILPDLAARLEEELIKRSIFGTAAIEGNPLSEEAVNKVLDQEKTKKNLERAEKQIRNLKEAYKIIKNATFSAEPFILEENLVREFHKVITLDSENPENIPGAYRNRPVKVGDEAHGGIYTPPKILDDIKKLMTEFIQWINSGELLKEDPAIRAGLAHYHIALIHPFENGNGRTARAVEALMMKKAGIKFIPHMMSNYYYSHLDEYFNVFSLSERNENSDLTPFVEFFLTGLVQSLKAIRGRMFRFIRKFTLRDYYLFLRKKRTVTQRQGDLLHLLLDSPEEFSLKEMHEKEKFRAIYRKVSERTARRDLQKLKAMRLLSEKQDGKFELNWRFLE